MGHPTVQPEFFNSVKKNSKTPGQTVHIRQDVVDVGGNFYIFDEFDNEGIVSQNRYCWVNGDKPFNSLSGVEKEKLKKDKGDKSERP